LFANGTAEKSKTNEGNDNDDDDEVPIIRSLRSRSRFVDEIDADKRMEPAASDEVQNAGVDNEDGEDNDDINSPHYHVDDNNGYRLRSRKRLISYSEKNPAVNRFERQNSPEPRSYTLRPRTEPKNYKVRIPLYEASPKKSEARRRQHTRFAINTRYEGGFGNNLRFGYHVISPCSKIFIFKIHSLSSMLLGPLGVENDDDSDVDAGELKNDNARLGNLTAELKPLNSSAFTGDDLERILINKQKSLSSKVLADTDPVAVDHAIDFSSIGGLREQVKSLKEMVLLPLLYPEVFTKFGLVPPVS
jgi:SpoVK/Ycf46/Vps4 family AAA+-type ATPase